MTHNEIKNQMLSNEGETIMNENKRFSHGNPPPEKAQHKKENTANNSSLPNNFGMKGPGPGKMLELPSAKPKDTTKTVKRLLGYLRKDRMTLAFAFICVLTNTILNLVSSYMLRPLINDLSVGKGIHVLVQNVIIMAIAYGIAIVANFLQFRIMIGISQRALEGLRNDLFEKMQKLPLRYFDTNSNGDTMSRFSNDVDSVGEMMSNNAITLFSSIITLIGTFLVMVITNIYLTIVTLTIIPLFYFVGKFITTKSRKYFKARQETLGQLNGFIEETIAGQKVIKVFNHEEEALKDFEIHNNQYREKVVKAQFLGGMMGPVMGGMGHLSYVITAFVGGFFCFLGLADIGAYAVFLNYSRTFSGPINQISMQMNVLYSAIAGAERVFDLMDETPEPQDSESALTPNKLEGFVKLDNVSFGYKKDNLVLKKISLYAKPGQKIAFVGSTGAGKTTITNLLNRFYDIESGVITIDGIDIKNFSKSYLRKNVAVVLQDTHLFEGTVMENIRYGRLDATDEDVITSAKAANAHSFIKKLEFGYDTFIESDGANLSQGQRQLLNIARAAISKAPILVLDEATSSVDTRTEKHIQQALDRLMATRTTFVIAHRLSTVRNSNAIIVLENGEIIERGDHEELLSNKGRYYELYEGIAMLT